MRSKKSVTSADLSKASNRADQRARLAFLNDEFTTRVVELRSKWGIPSDGLHEPEEILRWQKQTGALSNSTWISEMNQLVLLIRRSPRWRHNIERYIITGFVSGPIGPVIHSRINDYGATSILIELEPETTIEELKLHYGTIQEHLSSSFNVHADKFQPIKNLSRYLRIHELRHQGLTNGQIATKINIEFASQLKQDLYQNDIAKELSRLNKYIRANSA